MRKTNNTKTILKKIQLLVIITILGFINLLFEKKTYANNFEHKIKSPEKIKISEENFFRLLEFADGSFYSKVHGNKYSQVFGLHFALSAEGNTVAFSFCEDDMIGCNTYLLEYQTKATCERISGNYCNIIAIEKNLILNQKKIPLNDKNLKENFIIYKDKNITNYSYEIRAQNLRDFGNDDYNN